MLLSAVLCVGIFVREGTLGTYAAEDTQTARLRVKVETSSGTSTEFNGHAVLVSEIGDVQVTVKGEVRGDEIIYEVPNLQRGVKYDWFLSRGSGGNAYFVCSVMESNEAIVEQEILLYPVKFHAGNRLWNTQYVPFNSTVNKPYPSPVLQDCTFLYWATSPVTKEEYQFGLPKGPTSVYAIWKYNVTDNSLNRRLQEILNGITVSNSTSREYVEKYIQNQITSYFETESIVDASIFEKIPASTESSGTVKLHVSVSCEDSSASGEKEYIIPQLPSDRGWSLDQTGKLVISNQTGMNNWSNSGNQDNKEVVREIQIQEGVTNIPANAFNGCVNTVSATISGTVTNIGDSAFSGCSSLEKVVMQGTMPPSVGSAVFEQCKFTVDTVNTAGIVVPAGCEEAYKNAGGAFGEFVKGENQEILQDEFKKQLQQIISTAPVSNETTEEWFEQYIKKELEDYFQIDFTVDIVQFVLKGANVNDKGYISIDIRIVFEGQFYAGQYTVDIPQLSIEQVRGWTLDETGSLTITSQVGMDDWVQNGRTEENLSAVKNIVIQEGVTVLPDHAFSGCGSLNSVSLPGTVTGIGSFAFAGDSSLSGVTLPPNLQAIGDGAFSGCGSLDQVIMQGSVPPSVGNSVFDGCKFVTDSAGSGGIVVPPGSEDAYKTAGGVFEEYIKEEKPQITQEALDRKLQEIIGSLTVSNDTTQEEVRNAVKSAIDGYFRNDCAITIAEFGFLGNATADSEGALKLVVSVTCGGYTAGAEGIIPIAKLPPLPDRGWSLDEAGNLTIDSQAGMDDWTSGGRAEGRFPGVKKILIQGGVTNIPNDAFSGCCELGSIVIPDTVTSIGSLAFKHASSLAEITLPPHLQSIGDGAFSDCSSLEKLVMQGTTPPSLGTSVFDNCKFVENSSKGIVVPGGSEDAYKAAWGSLGANILEKHVHSYGAEWKSDENSHWHECSCGGKSDTAAHAWGEGTVTKEPTASEPGVMSYICSVCGMSKSESIPASGTEGGSGDGNEGGSGDGNGDGSGDGNGDGSGDGNEGGGGDGNPGGGAPSVSGNDHPDGGSVSGNDGPGDVTPSDPGDGHPGGENGGGGSPSVPESGNGDAPSGGGDSQPPTDNIDELALLWSTLTAEVPKDAEPRTADGVRLELYATVAMIAGFCYLLLLFLDRYDISEEKRRESLARLVRWAKCGGWPRRLPVVALLFVMRTYYRIADGQKVEKEKA